MKFQQATKLHIRYDSEKGLVSTEDLWSLSLPALDRIAMGLHDKLSAQSRVSFIGRDPQPNGETQLAFDVVLIVIEHKIAEREEVRNRADRVATKTKLLDLLEAKRNQELSALSSEELEKMVEALG